MQGRVIREEIRYWDVNNAFTCSCAYLSGAGSLQCALALFFNIVLSVLFGMPRAAAASDLFSPHSTVLIIASFAESGQSFRLTAAITSTKRARNRGESNSDRARQANGRRGVMEENT